MDVQIQTRNDGGDLRFFDRLAQAIRHAEEDRTVWKISFTIPSGERVRLVKDEDNGTWVYSPIVLGEV